MAFYLVYSCTIENNFFYGKQVSTLNWQDRMALLSFLCQSYEKAKY